MISLTLVMNSLDMATRYSMKKIFALVVFLFSFADLANACYCTADPYSKQYIYYTKTWYGTKRKWTCTYTCQNMQQQKAEIVGTHENWYVSDKGLEGICDGLVYVNRYSNFKMDFVWVYDRVESFSPIDSTAPELKRWGQSNCR